MSTVDQANTILPLSLGWQDGKMVKNGKITDIRFSAYRNTFKVLDYIPLVSIISGVAKVIFGIYALTTWDSKTIQIWDYTLWDHAVMVARGIISTLQLGLIFLPIDGIMFAVNRGITQKVNQKLALEKECEGMSEDNKTFLNKFFLKNDSKKLSTESSYNLYKLHLTTCSDAPQIDQEKFTRMLRLYKS